MVSIHCHLSRPHSDPRLGPFRRGRDASRADYYLSSGTPAGNERRTFTRSRALDDSIRNYFRPVVPCIFLRTGLLPGAAGRDGENLARRPVVVRRFFGGGAGFPLVCQTPRRGQNFVDQNRGPHEFCRAFWLDRRTAGLRDDPRPPGPAMQLLAGHSDAGRAAAGDVYTRDTGLAAAGGGVRDRAPTKETRRLVFGRDAGLLRPSALYARFLPRRRLAELRCPLPRVDSGAVF